MIDWLQMEWEGNIEQCFKVMEEGGGGGLHRQMVGVMIINIPLHQNSKLQIFEQYSQPVWSSRGGSASLMVTRIFDTENK